MNSLASVPGAILLVGAGKMGGAMLEAWLARGLPPALVSVIDPAPSSAAAKVIAARRIARDPQPQLIANHAAIVLAVKPQTASEVMPQLARFVGRDTVVVSIMAGRTIGFLAKNLPKGAAIVRAMPNTPASIGRGITVAVPNARVNTSARELADVLLSATGPVEWIKNEKWMDAVTAVSGSGPAYVFLLAESLGARRSRSRIAEAARCSPCACDRGRGRRALASVGPRRGEASRERDLAWRHDGGGLESADGKEWHRRLDEKGRSRGHAPLARARGLKPFLDRPELLHSA